MEEVARGTAAPDSERWKLVEHTPGDPFLGPLRFSPCWSLGFCHSSMGTERKESVPEKGHHQPVAIGSQETDTFSDWPLCASMPPQP